MHNIRIYCNYASHNYISEVRMHYSVICKQGGLLVRRETCRHRRMNSHIRYSIYVCFLILLTILITYYRHNISTYLIVLSPIFVLLLSICVIFFDTKRNNKVLIILSLLALISSIFFSIDQFSNRPPNKDELNSILEPKFNKLYAINDELRTLITKKFSQVDMTHPPESLDEISKKTNIPKKEILDALQAGSDYDRGLKALEDNKYDLALKLFKNYIGKGKDSDTWNLIGIAYFNKADKQNAIKAFDKATKISPSNSTAWYNLGTLLMGEMKNEEAITSFSNAVKYEPDDCDIFLNWGMALAKLNREHDAIDKFKKAIECKPDFPFAWNDWGVALNALGDNKESVEKYETALQYNPNYEEARSNLLRTLRALGRFEEAKQIILNSGKTDLK